MYPWLDHSLHTPEEHTLITIATMPDHTEAAETLLRAQVNNLMKRAGGPHSGSASSARSTQLSRTMMRVAPLVDVTGPAAGAIAPACAAVGPSATPALPSVALQWTVAQ